MHPTTAQSQQAELPGFVPHFRISTTPDAIGLEAPAATYKNVHGLLVQAAKLVRLDLAKSVGGNRGSNPLHNFETVHKPGLHNRHRLGDTSPAASFCKTEAQNARSWR
jgi:hypothetical protein